jgi:GDSL-like Lipase/Acylhydrolase.
LLKAIEPQEKIQTKNRLFWHRCGRPNVLICTPPCAFKPINRLFYITNDAKLDRVPEVAEIVRQVTKEEACELVDVYARTYANRRLFGPDGLHPSPAGAKAIAEEIYSHISHT